MRQKANFADNYSPLMWMLHNGPAATAHLTSAAEPRVDLASAAEPRGQDTRRAEVLKAEPTMPSLERMHQVSAANPRAQAKFFLLKTELHSKFCLGLQRVFIGRMALCSCARPRAPFQSGSNGWANESCI